ncbi:hypothetical protein F4X86_02805 [Candidatus Saccharibacteria bacterium]|nr:hypothetical protein [Candidatus Saccharibacteria bacterium]
MNSPSGKRRLVVKDKLWNGLHFCLRSLLPISVFLIVAFLAVPALAYVLILLSKWRILAAKPRFWWPNLRANAADLAFSFSLVLFMGWPSADLTQQLIWLAIYLLWVFVFKTDRLPAGHVWRGLAAQGMGAAALIYSLNQLPLPAVLAGIWLVSLIAVQHILSGFPKRDYHSRLTQIWGLFAIQLAWVMLHWQVNFWIIPNLAVLLAVVLLASSLLYSLHLREAAHGAARRQILASTLIVTFAVLIFSGLWLTTL